MDMILLEEDYLTVSYDKSYGYIYQKWRGFANSEKFRAGIDYFNGKFEELRLHKVVIDVRDQKSPAKADMDYAAQSINDFAESSNVPVRCAFVMPKSPVLQVGLKFFGKAIMGIKGVDINFVKTEEEALEWIKSVS